MEFPAVKTLVRRLFTDDDFRQAFLRSPEDVLRNYQASAEERQSLLRLHGRLVASTVAGDVKADPLTWP